MGGNDDLTRLLVESYGRAYRTAFLIMRDGSAAEEAVQEAFLRAWRFRGALPAGDALLPWLYRVLVNTCYSELRRSVPRRERQAGADPLAFLPAREPGPEDAVTAGSIADSVLDAVADLPAELRVPTVLRYWTGLTEKEIAIAIRRRPGTVKSRLHEARRRLAADRRIQALDQQRGEAQ